MRRSAFAAACAYAVSFDGSSAILLLNSISVIGPPAVYNTVYRREAVPGPTLCGMVFTLLRLALLLQRYNFHVADHLSLILHGP